MTLIRKVKKNVLQTFRELYNRGKQLNIHKTTFLSQTYEKNCWRKTRLREEKVYHKKYKFLKHAYDVVNYGIDKKLKFQIEEKNIIEEDSYLPDQANIIQNEKSIKKNVNHIDNERKDILNYLENMNSKYNKNYKQISQLYYNVMNKNVILKKNEFLKKYKNFYSPTDLTIIYYYLKKFQLLTNKKKQLTNKIQILNSRKNVFDKVNYSFSLRKLEDMFYTHGKKINVL